MQYKDIAAPSLKVLPVSENEKKLQIFFYKVIGQPNLKAIPVEGIVSLACGFGLASDRVVDESIDIV